MSAIWGIHSFKQNIDTIGADPVMSSPYRKKCKLDSIDTVSSKSTYMGCGLQKIAKYSETEKLPIIDDANHLVLSADCIFDNHEELALSLSLPTDTPDGELLHQAYLRYGIDCITGLRGIYSFAIYDQTNNLFYLATDPTASRCVYYSFSEGTVLFSSLIAPICAMLGNVTPNENYLTDFIVSPGLMPSVSATETPYTNIYKVAPGTYLKFTSEAMTEVSYWTPDSIPHPRYSSANEVGTAFRKLFEDCVNCAVNTPHQVGIALSSGLDSASIAALVASSFRKNAKLSAKTLYSYTYVPSESGGRKENRDQVLDETSDLNSILSMHPNIKPTFLTNHGKNCFVDMRLALEYMEIPFKAIVNFPNLLEIYETAYADGCRILLTGQCGNSTISNGYIDDVLYDFYRKHDYIAFLNTLNQYAKANKESRKKALKGCRNYFQYANKEYADATFRYTPSNPFATTDWNASYPFEERMRANEILNNSKLPSHQERYKIMLYNKAMYSYLGELDTKMSLAYGIIIRDPSRDCRMISFCNSLPYKYFAYNGTPRWLIRGNLRDILPTALLDNWMRYGVQNADWFVRMKRDWNTLYPDIKRELENIPVGWPVDHDRIASYLAQTVDGLSDPAENDTLFILILYNLLAFKRQSFQET